MPLPTPPLDLSGGILTMGYTDGADEHFLGLHVRPFAATASGSPADWLYTSGTGFSETGVLATATNLAAKLVPFYNSDWNFWIQGLHKLVSGLLVPCFPLPVLVSNQTGTGSTAVTLSDTARICASIYTADSVPSAAGQPPGRFRVMLVAAGDRSLQVPAIATASAGGIDTTNDPALVAYLTGGVSAIVAHNGQKPAGAFKVQVTEREHLRRKYGFA